MSYYTIVKKQQFYKKKWLALNPELTDECGIYILTRADENGFRYCYVGQAKKILTRLCSHSLGYQHIDLSIKKHGLFSSENPYGWKVERVYCDESQLDSMEKQYVLHYANLGYQLRNRTTGSQGNDKTSIVDDQSTKGYHDGLKKGYENCLKDIREYFDKYLRFDITFRHECRKKDGTYKEIYLKKYKEFDQLMKGQK